MIVRAKVSISTTKERARTILTNRPDLAVIIFFCLLVSFASMFQFIFTEADENNETEEVRVGRVSSVVAPVSGVLHADDASQSQAEENERPLVYPWARQLIRPLSIKPIRNETSVYWQ